MANTIINGGASPYPKHVGPAAICSFSDGAQDAPLKSLAFTIEPNQSGSGDPSPSNIRPISGWSQVDGKQSGEDMTDYTPITIALGQTVYGGTVDALNGKCASNMQLKTLTGNQSWADSAGVNGYVLYNVLNVAGTRLDLPCNMFKALLAGESTSLLGVIFGNGNKHLYVQQANTIPGVTDLASWKTFLNNNNMQVVVPLATQTEIDLTPVSVNSLLGQNNIWCNTGDTELDYYPAAASVVAVMNKLSKVYTSIPLDKIRYDTYQTTPNQALDLDSYRAETGVLIRNVLSHTATKIEFNTPSMTNLQWEEVWNIIKAGFNNSTERKLKLKYYDQMSATYKTGWFYVPDVQFTIRNIDEASGIINYDEVRVAFIEY